MRKPAIRSNENPCLNADDSQVGRAIEHTEDPLQEHTAMLPIMQQEELQDLEGDGDLESGFRQWPLDEYHHEHDSEPRVASSSSFQQFHAGDQHFVPQLSCYTHHEPSFPQHLGPCHRPDEHCNEPSSSSSSFHPSRPSGSYLHQHSQADLEQRQLERHQTLHRNHQPQHEPSHSAPFQPTPFYYSDSGLRLRVGHDQHHHSTIAQLPPHQQHHAGEHMVNYSISAPLPPTVRGAGRLNGSLRNMQTLGPIRPSPYALPGLRKVTVYGPRRQGENYRGQWQNTGVVHVRPSGFRC